MTTLEALIENPLEKRQYSGIVRRGNKRVVAFVELEWITPGMVKIAYVRTRLPWELPFLGQSSGFGH